MSSDRLELAPMSAILEDVRSGKLIVLVDDEDRENEGDLVIAAERVTPEAINFMMHEGKGLICLSLTQERVQELAIPLQVQENTAPLGTNFTVSIDHISVVNSGVTAAGRATTIRAAVDPKATAADFVQPGFVFPLSAHQGGVLKRAGQTEGSVDLARLAGLTGAGVICEIMDDTGEMICGDALVEYCRRHNLKLTSVAAVKEYRLRQEISLRRVAECEISNLCGIDLPGLPEQLLTGTLRVFVYLDDADNQEQLVFVKGNPKDGCLVRIHSECLTGDVFGSKRCDCASQFQQALSAIIAASEGVVVYLHQEGRGIGLGNKLRAYELQDQGFDTVEANLMLGFAPDARNYRAGALILADLGLRSVRLMTNNPTKVASLEEFGIAVIERIPALSQHDPLTSSYLQTKREKLGHLIPHCGGRAS